MGTVTGAADKAAHAGPAEPSYSLTHLFKSLTGPQLHFGARQLQPQLPKLSFKPPATPPAVTLLAERTQAPIGPLWEIRLQGGKPLG